MYLYKIEIEWGEIERNCKEETKCQPTPLPHIILARKKFNYTNLRG
jgi:hypothetical protein